jgi:hypothetical protein
MSLQKSNSQSGNVLVYIMLTIFFIGLLIVTLTQGTSKNVTTQQLDSLTTGLKSDIDFIETTIDECAASYTAAIDVNNDNAINTTDNPNAPYPLYTVALTNSGVGTALATVYCPGSHQPLFDSSTANNLKLLGSTTVYTTTFFNETTEGVLVRITRATASDLWTTAISRLNTRYSECKAAVVTDGGTCLNGCFYYWFKRPATSVIGIPEAGCTL